MAPSYLRYAFIFALAFAGHTVGLGADQDKRFTVLSMGSKSCGNVVSDFKAEGTAKLNNSIWVAGYLTALNEFVVARKNIAEGTDPAAWDLWINNFCSANPLENLAGAASALAVEMNKRTSK